MVWALHFEFNVHAKVGRLSIEHANLLGLLTSSESQGVHPQSLS